MLELSSARSFDPLGFAAVQPLFSPACARLADIGKKPVTRFQNVFSDDSKKLMRTMTQVRFFPRASIQIGGCATSAKYGLFVDSHDGVGSIYSMYGP
jgi:hypothetical protein